MSNNSTVERILAYIETNLSGDLTLDKLAEEFNYSRFYIARIFQEYTGCTVYKYVQGRRLTEAARKLVETDEAIVEIACEAHYSSQQAFTLAFRQLYLDTPQRYRENGIFCPKRKRFALEQRISGRCLYGAMRMMAGGRAAA